MKFYISLKLTIIIISCAFIVLGITILSIAISQISQYDILWEYVDESYKNYTLASLCVFGTITILVGILGIFGVFKKKYWVICAFYISSSIIAITLIVLGCIINNFANNEYQQIKNDKNCTGNEFQWLLYANLACNSAQQMLCSFPCACYVKNKQDFPSGTFQIYQNVVSKPEFGVTNVQSCKGFNLIPAEEQKYIPLAKFVEEKFECSGFCKPVKYYLFSDINRGAPKYSSSCKERIEIYFESYIKNIQIFAFVVGAIFITFIILVLLLCFIKKKNLLNEDNLNTYFQLT